METIQVRKYRDAYGDRLALKYRYNPDTNAAMKCELDFPKFKWDKDERAWSVQDNKSVISEACEVLERLGYDTTIVRQYTDSLPESQQNKSECWTKVKNSRLYLHWPYLSNSSLREKVRLSVRSINGRKFHAEEKCWSIPIVQARTLHGILEGSYAPLAKAILDNPDVEKDVKESIARVEMSSAASLNDSKMDEINKALEGKFPEGLDLYPFQKVAVAFAEASGGKCLIGDEMGIGKAQPLTAMLLTPNGWKSMGEIQEGDEVIGSDGKSTTVMGVYPQGEKSIYKVTFSDGTSTECCGEHLWTVTTPNRKHRGQGWTTKTLDQMVEEGIRTKPSGKVGGRQGSRSKGNRKWYVPVMEAAEFPEANQSIDPYTLGVLLGDGGIKYAVYVSTEDQEILDKMVLPKGLSIKHTSGCDYRISQGQVGGKPNKMKAALMDLGLFGKGSFDKFVPDCYKFASKEQRLEVLRGLMDTDGTVNKQNGQVSFSSGSEQLSADVAWLVRSLGGVARITPRPTASGNTDHRVSISVDDDTVIFHLPRKIERLVKRTKYQPTRSIDSVEYVGEKEAQCISVSADNCLYVTDDFIVTHNTISAIGYAAINPEDRPMVVVCPANVKFNWKNELNKWLPNEDVQVISKGKDEVKHTDIVVINYDLMHKKQTELMCIAPRLVVLDEVHYLKNSGSKDKPVKRTVATLTVAKSSPKVIALSGTAISSRPKEFFNTLNLMRPEQFSSFWNFAQRYCDPWHNGWSWNFDGASHVKELNERTRDLCIRRLKSEVLPELPPKTRSFLPIHLTKSQREEYDLSQEEWDRRINDHYLNSEPLPPGMMLNMLSDLRHICGRTKIPFATDWIADYHQQTGKPIVVFAHHRDVISGLVKQLNAVKQYQSMNVDTITGSVSSKNRQDIVDNFQKGEIDVLICNTVAAKEGITLTAADTVLFIEREWVPTDEEQAEDRVYRIGQESQHVHAVYLSIAGTVDEHFDRVVESKRQVVKAVLDGGDMEQRKGLVSELVKKLKQERGWKMEVKDYANV